MNKCTEINSQIAARSNVTYINLRSMFEAADKGQGWDQQSGYFTLDGMRPSATGAELEQKDWPCSSLCSLTWGFSGLPRLPQNKVKEARSHYWHLLPDFLLKPSFLYFIAFLFR
jgi:hypothetical protein